MLFDFYEYDRKSVIQRYNALAEYVRYEDLADVSAHTPIINGKKMAEVLKQVMKLRTHRGFLYVEH